MSRRDELDELDRMWLEEPRRRRNALIHSIMLLVVYLFVAFGSRMLLPHVPVANAGIERVFAIFPYIFLALAILQVSIVLGRWSLWRSTRGIDR